VLGVARDADEKTIKNAFRQLALKYHPDRNKEPGAEKRFKEIAEAYAILSDPQKRAQYDTRGFAGVAGFSPEDLFGGINFEDIFGGLNFDFGGGIFERFFRRRPSGPPRGEDLEVDLVVPLETVANGGSEKVRYANPQVCPDCKGSGAKPGTSPRQCAKCKGIGHEVTSRREANVLLQRFVTCTACGGRGNIIDEVCPNCGGRGQVIREEELEITIPRGVEDGMVLRVPGHGRPPRHRGGIAGDLYGRITGAPDARFTRSGADLWREETISIPDAVLGTNIKVPTLQHTATVYVPPGTPPGTVLRLKGKGLPEFGDKEKGDILLRIVVKIPERLSPEEKSLYEQLRRLAAGRSR
jgi:molecular chaperone DnaJ